MFKLNKEKLELNIIPSIMLIISIIIAFTSSENIRIALLLIVSFLLGMQIQKVIYKLKDR